MRGVGKDDRVCVCMFMYVCMLYVCCMYVCMTEDDEEEGAEDRLPAKVPRVAARRSKGRGKAATGRKGSKAR